MPSPTLINDHPLATANPKSSLNAEKTLMFSEASEGGYAVERFLNHHPNRRASQSSPSALSDHVRTWLL